MAVGEAHGRSFTPERRGVWRWRVVAGAGLAAYALAVALAAYATDADDEGRRGLLADHVELTLLAVLLLQPLVAFAVGKWSFLLLVLPWAGAWWAERDDVPGYLDFVSLKTVAFLYVLFLGLPLTGVGVFARAYVDERRGRNAARPATRFRL
jgi:hypothetical protein